jgi:hypothetical protein
MDSGKRSAIGKRKATKPVKISFAPLIHGNLSILLATPRIPS